MCCTMHQFRMVSYINGYVLCVFYIQNDPINKVFVELILEASEILSLAVSISLTRFVCRLWYVFGCRCIFEGAFGTYYLRAGIGICICVSRIFKHMQRIILLCDRNATQSLNTLNLNIRSIFF